jgi:hypothetical protein
VPGTAGSELPSVVGWIAIVDIGGQGETGSGFLPVTGSGFLPVVKGQEKPGLDLLLLGVQLVVTCICMTHFI